MGVKQEAVKLYEVKIVLMDLAPMIWRRVSVPRDITLGDLHQVIQIAMGWEDCHLHEFFIGRKRYGPMMVDPFGFDDPAVDEDIVHLNGVAKPKAKFIYHYDFGDDWRHEIHIEREVESTSNKRQARCLAGENACPPEDCGGPYGYPNLMAILSDPQHEEHGEMREWIGDHFDPQQFDLALIDRRLSKHKI
jgi:hypothetical protein